MVEHMRAQKAVLFSTDFDKLEIDMGWSWIDDCAFVDPVCQRLFKPITMQFPDWMHVWVVNGIANREIVLFLHEVKTTAKHTLAQVDGFMDKFVPPHNFRKLSNPFSRRPA